MPIEKNHYVCIPAIDIDSVLKVDKKVFPQAYLEQYKRKYKLKKRRPVNFIDIEIIDDDDEDDGYDSYNENENKNENIKMIFLHFDNHKNAPEILSRLFIKI